MGSKGSSRKPGPWMSVAKRLLISWKVAKKLSSCVGSDMSNPERSEVYNKLRTLAAQNPRTARTLFCQMLDANAPELDEVLRCAAVLGEGRVRQLIANAIRSRPDKDTLAPHLLQWLET